MVTLCSTSLEESLKDLFQALVVKWGTVEQGLSTTFMPLHPDERCCAASLLILLPLLPSFQDRMHPSEPKQNKPTPLNWLFPGIRSQQGGSNLNSSPRVPWHNENIQEAKKSQSWFSAPSPHACSASPACHIPTPASAFRDCEFQTILEKGDLPPSSWLVPSLPHPAGPLSHWDPGVWADEEEQLRREPGCPHACSRQRSFSPEAEMEQKKTSLIRSHCPRQRPVLGLT